MDRVHLFYAQQYKINDVIAYCIEPGVAINTNKYFATDELYLSGIDSETLNYINLIMYYGYDYPGHHTNYYYMATQELIWNKLTGRDTYWVEGESVNSPRLNLSVEKQKILELVNLHTLKPSFLFDNIQLEVGVETIIEDENKVLSNYEVISPDGVDALIDGNKLRITPTRVLKKANIKLIKKTYIDGSAMLYYNGSNQKLLSVGAFNPMLDELNVSIDANVRVKVVKIDQDTGNRINMSNIKFKFKNLDTGEYICENINNCIYETDNSGSFITSNNFNFGHYQLEELENSILPGYLWNSEPLVFDITEDNKYIYQEECVIYEINFANKSVKGKLKINKIGEELNLHNGTYTYDEIPLTGVVYELYADNDIYSSDGILVHENGKLIQVAETNNGLLEISDLYLGNYCLIEKETVLNHLVDLEKHCFSLQYLDAYTEEIIYNYNLKNYLPKGYFELVKLDYLTNEYLPGAIFEIYGLNDDLIYVGETNEFGKLVVDNLPLGTYYYIEVKAPYGYEASNEKKIFTIAKDGDIIYANVINERIIVPDTYLNYSNLFCIISLFLFLLGLFLLIYDNKKKK